jgi:divalent metal cation (Fe/Co/Zn/Cd) transporter
MNNVHEGRDDQGTHSHAGSIGWPRAILSAAIVVVVGIGVLVYGTDAVLNIHGKTRSSLVAIVTPAFFVLLIALAWALRRLQRQGII